MEPTRLERRKAATRRNVITVTLRLIEQQGYDTITMEQIAAEADIAKGTLYNYFPVKEAILSAYIQQTFKERHAARVEQLRNLPDTRSRMQHLFNDLIVGIQSKKDIFLIYLMYQLQHGTLEPDAEQASGLGLLVREMIELGQQGGEIRADVPFPILADLLEYTLIEVIKQFYLDPISFEAQTVIEWCVDLFLRGAQTQ